ncbi:MAG: two pore domain potassium channel family protein [Candidatus Cloacimonetes bacterium]|nr:two pore domain potassium channel family protein [Candidatus Cloacimonadota bacterium]
MRRKIFLFLEKISLLGLLGYFVITVILFAIIYCSFTPGENGIKTSQEINFNIWQGLYFSIVTISSLGYGDMQPLGYSQLFAVIEVILGLTLMGMLIAKLTSSRLSYHVKRIYVSDSQRQLYGYLHYIRNCTADIVKAILLFSPKMVETPILDDDSTSDKKYSILLERARRAFSIPLKKLNKSLNELKKYFYFEVKNVDFFSEIPIEIIKDVGSSIEEFQNQIYTFLIDISEKRRNELLYGEPGKYFNFVIVEIMELCDIVKNHTKETNVKLLFSNILNKSTIIKNDIIIISVPIYEYEPPNQINPESINPIN